jgi:hypothetical protein
MRESILTHDEASSKGPDGATLLFDIFFAEQVIHNVAQFFASQHTLHNAFW